MKQVDKYIPKTKPRAKPEAKPNKKGGGNFVDRLGAYRDMHAQALFSSLGRLLAAPFNTSMTIGVLALAIALACGFYLTVVNIHQFTGHLEASNQISLFLREEISEPKAKNFAETIRKNPAVEHVKVITKQQAMAEFKKFSGFGEAIELLEKNPLPVVVEVQPKDTLTDRQAVSELLENLKKSTEVDFAQMDMLWVERLQTMVSMFKRATIMITALIALSIFFIAGNTIRLEIHDRRHEIVIAKLVGATNGFIQRPFLYTGFWLGLLSGICAWFINAIILLVLRPSIETLSGLYEGNFRLQFLGYLETFILLIVSVLLTVIGSWVVLQFQIKKLQPE